MSHLYYIFLGFLQGLTEFLPVSSSGHLASIQHFFSQAQKESLLIEITAHLGSLFAIAVYYRHTFIKSFSSILKTSSNESLFKYTNKLFILFLSTLPTGLIGLFLKKQVTTLFTDIKAVAYGFIFTSFILLLTFFLNKKSKKTAQKQDWPSPFQAIFIGFAQAFALLPGVSRSGSTIAAGVLSGLKPQVAAFFSFCSVAPLILAASLLSLFEVFANPNLITEVPSSDLLLLLTSSFLFGWLGLSLVVKFLERGKFHYFSFYLFPLALSLFIWG